MCVTVSHYKFLLLQYLHVELSKEYLSKIKLIVQPNNFLSLEQVIDRQPLIVTPETPAIEVIKRMQEWGNNW